jgi:hypothetical protein
MHAALVVAQFAGSRFEAALRSEPVNHHSRSYPPGLNRGAQAEIYSPELLSRGKLWLVS